MAVAQKPSATPSSSLALCSSSSALFATLAARVGRSRYAGNTESFLSVSRFYVEFPQVETEALASPATKGEELREMDTLVVEG